LFCNKIIQDGFSFRQIRLLMSYLYKFTSSSLPPAIFSKVDKMENLEDLQKQFEMEYYSNESSFEPALYRRCAPSFVNATNWHIIHTVVRSGVSFLIPLMLMIGCNVGMISALFSVVRNQSYRAKKSFLGTRKRRITKVNFRIYFI